MQPIASKEQADGADHRAEGPGRPVNLASRGVEGPDQQDSSPQGLGSNDVECLPQQEATPSGPPSTDASVPRALPHNFDHSALEVVPGEPLRLGDLLEQSVTWLDIDVSDSEAEEDPRNIPQGLPFEPTGYRQGVARSFSY